MMKEFVRSDESEVVISGWPNFVFKVLPLPFAPVHEFAITSGHEAQSPIYDLRCALLSGGNRGRVRMLAPVSLPGATALPALVVASNADRLRVSRDA
jgi:hypothetical protein